MNLFKMAWRNIWRNRRRTLVTVAAMSLALWVMILYSGIVAGYLVSMERNILDLELGDIQIFAGDYRNDPSLHTRIEDPDALLSRLDKAGYPASARLLAAGLAAAGESSAGVTFRGLNVKRDARVSFINNNVAQGSWLDPNDPKGVVLGKRLARTLNVKPGAEIVVLSQGADGSMANDLYRVRGVLMSISEMVDRTGIFMTEEAFRRLLVLPGGAHQIIVRKPQQQELQATAVRVKNLAPDLDVKTWQDLVPTLASMLQSSRSAVFIMFTIVFIAIGIVILNAMLMAVFERIREFGVLKALGVSPADVLKLIFLESAMQTGLAMVVGGLLSIPGSIYLINTGIDLGGGDDISISGIAMDTTMKAAVDASTVIKPIVTMIVIVFIAVLYPAVKAALIRPVEAIRHQ